MKSLAALFAIFLIANSNSLDRQQGVTVHEWGTFTTGAGPDGSPVNWLPRPVPF